jgi:cupin superfamily acireductone dioxygenase involved in methionine salvage
VSSAPPLLNFVMSEQSDPQPNDSKNDIIVDELYLDLSPEERAEAEYYLNRYVELIERIYERTGR